LEPKGSTVSGAENSRKKNGVSAACGWESSAFLSDWATAKAGLSRKPRLGPARKSALDPGAGERLTGKKGLPTPKNPRMPNEKKDEDQERGAPRIEFLSMDLGGKHKKGNQEKVKIA